jgi:hypothetical protein
VARLLRKGMIAELDIPAPARRGAEEAKDEADKPEPAKAAPAKASK